MKYECDIVSKLMYRDQDSLPVIRTSAYGTKVIGTAQVFNRAPFTGAKVIVEMDELESTSDLYLEVVAASIDMEESVAVVVFKITASQPSADTTHLRRVVEPHSDMASEMAALGSSVFNGSPPAQVGLSFEDYHLEILSTLKRSGDLMKDVNHMAFGLDEEAGEVAGEMKRLYREDGGELTDDRRKAILKEIGDVLWYCCALAYLMDPAGGLEAVAKANLEKLASRKARGVLDGRGSDR